MLDYRSLSRGDVVRVKFGARGSQTAIVVGWTKSRHLMVCKWRASSRMWLAPTRLEGAQLLDSAVTVLPSKPEPDLYLPNLTRSFKPW